MNKTSKHLYIHIPFCKYICTYCDFVRKIPKSEIEIEQYLDVIISKINEYKTFFKTIYIGGGTPNFVNNFLLEKLFISLQKNIDKKTEFTIECNPDFVTEDQAKLFSKYKVNRISLGVQTTSNSILKLLNRKHTILDAENAIKIFSKHKIYNISCDFIYNLPLLKKRDILDAINFCIKNDVKHISFYSLEIKDGSILKKFNHKIDEDQEEKQFNYLLKIMRKTKFKRYEVSNWSISKKYRSKHNLAYWNLDDWIGLGLGAYGLEKRNYYTIVGDYKNFKLENNFLSLNEYYLYALMMGLRLTDGMKLVGKNKKAYEYFKDKLNKSMLKIKNNRLVLKNVNLLHSLLVDIV